MAGSRSRTGTLAAVASSDPARARALAEEAGAPGNVTAYGDYAALHADPGVDAVYIATRAPPARPPDHRLCTGHKPTSCARNR